MSGGMILGFKIGFSAYNNADEGTTNRSVTLNNVLIEVQGKLAPLEEPRAIGARISRGNKVQNCTIRAKSAGFNAYPLETTMNSVGTSDSVGVFIISNRLETDTNTIVYQTPGLQQSNCSVVLNNYGFAKNGSTTPGQTGFAADFFHNTATSQYGNTTFINNYFWASSRAERITLTLPLYLNIIKSD